MEERAEEYCLSHTFKVNNPSDNIDANSAKNFNAENSEAERYKKIYRNKYITPVEQLVLI